MNFLPIKSSELIIVKPEFAIYFYIPNHLQRLQVNIFTNIFFNVTVLHYNLKNSQLKLEQKNNSFIYQIFLTKWIYYTIDKQKEINIEQNKHYNFVLTETILKETKKELEQEGFTIINSEDLIGRKFKYHSEDTNIDEYHPSEKAWDILLPPLIKKINI